MRARQGDEFPVALESCSVNEREQLMDQLPDLRPAARRVAALASAVTDDQLAGPTPCPDYAVRNILGHLLSVSTVFRDAGRKDLGAATATAPASMAPDVDDEGRWRAVLPQALEELAEVWRDPAAWEGVAQAGGVKLPGDHAGAVALNEVVIHGWDLARATGQPYEADEQALRVSEAMLTPFAEDPGRESPFGRAVEAPAGASLLDRVIALSGRDPGWTP
jgi:uncharacterized protein (TIGR03086 family)